LQNVGGLLDVMKLKLIEPLRELFKDEVRQLGELLGLDEASVWRHPFPGPGLAIRILGEVTAEQCRIARQADYIFIDEIRKAGLYRQIAQGLLKKNKKAHSCTKPTILQRLSSSSPSSRSESWVISARTSRQPWSERSSRQTS